MFLFTVFCCCFCSVAKSCLTLQPHGLLPARLPCPSLSPSLLRLMSIELLMPSNHFILCHPLLLPSIYSSIRVFSNKLALCIKLSKYWNFSFSISPSSDYSGLISFRIDWFDLLAVKETQDSSPSPQFESINSLMLSLLYGPTPTSIDDYWKNHNFDYNGSLSAK